MDIFKPFFTSTSRLAPFIASDFGCYLMTALYKDGELIADQNRGKLKLSSVRSPLFLVFMSYLGPVQKPSNEACKQGCNQSAAYWN